MDILIIDSRFDCIKKNKKSFLEVLNKNLTKSLKLIFSDNADNSGQIKIDFLDEFSFALNEVSIYR